MAMFSSSFHRNCIRKHCRVSINYAELDLEIVHCRFVRSISQNHEELKRKYQLFYGVFDSLKMSAVYNAVGLFTFSSTCGTGIKQGCFVKYMR